MKRVNVVVEEYNLNWINYFNEIKKELESALKETAVDIEHVGSTAVKGLAAKSIIDIDVLLRNLSDLDMAIQKLVDIKYKTDFIDKIYEKINQSSLISIK